MTTKPKYKILWPTEKPNSPDTTIQYIYLSNVLFTAGFFFLAVYVILSVILWRPFMAPGVDFSQFPKSPFFHAVGSLLWPISFVKVFETSYALDWHRWLGTIKEQSAMLAIIARFITIWAVSIYAGYIGWKSAWKPSGGVKHIKGRQLLKGQEAYEDLKREFNYMSDLSGGSGFIVAVDNNVKYSPEENLPETIQFKDLSAVSIEKRIGRKSKEGGAKLTFDECGKEMVNKTSELVLKKKTFISKPLEKHSLHSAYIGGTGRGKTNTVLNNLISQAYNHIRQGENRKIFLCDTPKAEYRDYFKKEDITLIAPQVEDSAVWDISKDLNNSLMAEEWWKGRIPPASDNPIWTNSAVAVATGCTTTLIKMIPSAWNYGLLAHMLSKDASELIIPLREYYPEANQVMKSAEETLSSVMFTIGSYSNDIIQLARIYDAYDSKAPLLQANIKALQFDDYQKFWKDDIFKINNRADDGKIFMSIVKALNIRFEKVYDEETKEYIPGWNWTTFYNHIKDNAFNLSTDFPVIDGSQVNMMTLITDTVSHKIFNHIVQYHKEWDRLEGLEKLSIREWIADPDPKKKILVLQPNELAPSLTEGLIKGILYYANKVILGELEDNAERKFHLLIDEFQSYGNISEFIKDGFSLYRSRGIDITICFQDTSQLVEIYGEQFVDFMLSNLGNINVVGLNAGNSNEKMSSLLGSRTISKLHKTLNKGKEGGSSENLQEHEEVVMSPSEFNTLGASKATKSIKYLYLCGGINNGYILEIPIRAYKRYSNGFKKNSQLTNAYQKPIVKDFIKSIADEKQANNKNKAIGNYLDKIAES